MTPSTLQERLARLEAEAALHALKAEYAAAADAKYLPSHCPAPRATYEAAAARQAACFSEDAIWEAGEFGGTRSGRAALLEFFLQSPWQFATHLYAAPSLRIAGREAEGEWRLWQLGLRGPAGPVVLLTGRTKENYVRDETGWRIARLAFTELHSVTLSPDRSALVHLVMKS